MGLSEVTLFNIYLMNIRTDYSTYVANISADIHKKGTRTLAQRRKAVKTNYFTAYMDIMNNFNPSETKHKLNAAAMQDVVNKINYLAGTSYDIDFSIYY